MTAAAVITPSRRIVDRFPVIAALRNCDDELHHKDLRRWTLQSTANLGGLPLDHLRRRRSRFRAPSPVDAERALDQARDARRRQEDDDDQQDAVSDVRLAVEGL